jgi:hypothetical protein
LAQHHEIGAQRQWALQYRRQKGVIHGHQCASGLHPRAQIREIDYPQQRVRRTFHPHQPRLPRDRGRQCHTVLLVDHLDTEQPARSALREQAESAAVAIPWRHHEVPWIQQLQYQVDRGHARAGDRGSGTLFQAGQRVGQRVAGWVRSSRVIVGPGAPQAFEREGGAEVQRRHNRVVLRVGVHRRADGAGLARLILAHEPCTCDDPDLARAVLGRGSVWAACKSGQPGLHRLF